MKGCKGILVYVLSKGLVPPSLAVIIPVLIYVCLLSHSATGVNLKELTTVYAGGSKVFISCPASVTVATKRAETHFPMDSRSLLSTIHR